MEGGRERKKELQEKRQIITIFILYNINLFAAC